MEEPDRVLVAHAGELIECQSFQGKYELRWRCGKCGADLGRALYGVACNCGAVVRERHSQGRLLSEFDSTRCMLMEACLYQRFDQFFRKPGQQEPIRQFVLPKDFDAVARLESKAWAAERQADLNLFWNRNNGWKLFRSC
jgi:hypothetical protein